MIGVKVDKNKSQATVQKKSNAANKSLSSAPVTQLCGEEKKDDKTVKDGTNAFTERNSFWSPDTIQGQFYGNAKQLNSSPSFPAIQLKSNTTGLPDNVKSGTEQLSGVSLDDVKVHYNSSQPAQLSAHAFAQGTDIHVAPGQEKHVPHEAWHVVQQKQGRVQATTQMKGMVPVNDDSGLEKEADVMGAKAIQMASIENETPIQQKAISGNGVVQREGKEPDPSEWPFEQKRAFFETNNPMVSMGGQKIINQQPSIDPSIVATVPEEAIDEKKEIPSIDPSSSNKVSIEENSEMNSIMAGKENKLSFFDRMKLAFKTGKHSGGSIFSVFSNWAGSLFGGSKKIATEGIKGSGNLAMSGIKGSGSLAMSGINESSNLAMSGIKGSGSLAMSGIKGSGSLAMSGIKGSGSLAMSGINESSNLAMSGIKGSGNLAMSGIKGSGNLAMSGIKGSGSLAMGGINDSINKGDELASSISNSLGGQGTTGAETVAGIGMAGAKGLGMAGAVGAAGLGTVGAVGAAGLGTVGAVGAAGLGTVGVVGAAGLGTVGAVGAAGLGTVGAVGAAGLGTVGAVGAAGLGTVGAVGAAGLGTVGAVGAAGLGTIGAVGAAGLGTVGAVGAAGLGTIGAVGAAGLGTVGAITGFTTALGIGLIESIFQIDSYLDENLFGNEVDHNTALNLIDGVKQLDASVVDIAKNKINKNSLLGDADRGFWDSIGAAIGISDTNVKTEDDTTKKLNSKTEEGAISTLTGLVGKGVGQTESLHNTLGGNQAAESLAAGIGDLIVGALNSINAIRHAWDIFNKPHVNKWQETKILAYNLTVATKAGFTAALHIQNYISKSIPPHVGKIIPGLGIAISVCDTLISIHKWRQAAEIEDSLYEDERTPDNNLIIVNWNNVKENIEKNIGENIFDNRELFVEDIRGKRNILDFMPFITPGSKWSNLNNYVRIKQEYYPIIVKLSMGVNEGEFNSDETQKFNKIKHILGGKSGTELQKTCKLLTQYQLVSKLHEINNKRNIQGQRETGANLITLAGNVASLFPADGGIIAGVLLGTGAGIGVAMKAGNMFKQYDEEMKDRKSEKSDDDDGSRVKKGVRQKNIEYVEHAASILGIFKDIEVKENIRSYINSNTKEEKEVIMKSDSGIENKIKSFVHKKIEGDHLVSAAGIDRFDFYHKVHKYDKDSLVELTIFIANKLGSGR